MPHVGPGVQEALVGIFLETLLYGAFFVISVDCARALRHRMLSGNTHWYMLSTFVALFIFITMRVVVDLKRTIVSFCNPSDEGAIDLGAPASVESIMTNLLLVLITVTADMFLVYRIYIVWKRTFYIIIVPILLCLGTAGGGIYVVYCLANAVPKNGIAAYLRIATAFSYFLYFTLAANVFGTLLIAGRIFWIRRQSARTRSGTDAVTHIVTLIVESAAIYSAVLIAEITVIARGSHADFLFINLIGPLVGIVFAYIIIRASSSTSSQNTSRGHTSALSAGYTGGGHHSNFSRGGPQYETRPRHPDQDPRVTDPVQIRLETMVHTESDLERDKY
ncbi:hypothetical protein EXIGLDRAFT_776977 [Exidia glandulosa HHB12029]|uniref:Uncharacterized protein n=1 Tax=Exidia glandulosa HHB12029 TaxID=1314781 RepID=A0A165D8W8_EXIGL|nr:hypothetical protein EXIGLDRAFT_776977 [Exidia glandulosa HHB12029]